MTAVAAVVVVHLLVTLAHGAAHTQAHVPLSTAASAFVFIVILAGPLAGLLVARWSRAAGNAIIAVTMAAALLFGVVNHFVLASPDHVAQVSPDWRTWFSTTAVLLAVTEALAVVLAGRMVRAR